MDINPVTSYFEVKKVVSFVRDSNPHLNEDFVCCVGLCSAGLSYDDEYLFKYRYNHYLMDSLGIKKFPEIKKDNNFDEKVLSFTSNALKSLRDSGDIKGDDKFFTEDQKKYLMQNGYLIIPSVLSDEQVDILSKLTLFIAEEEDKSKVSYRYGDDGNNLQRIYNLISKHPIYLEVLQLPIMKEILEFYFKRNNLHHKYVLSSFQSNIIYPGGEAQQLHVDGLGYTDNPLPGWPTRLNLNFLLTDWTKTNGATMLLPRSHRFLLAPMPNEISDDELLILEAPKGSLVIWTGHLWHKSGENKSDFPRFGLFSCFAASQLKEMCTEEEHLSVVDEGVVNGLSPEMRFMLGFDRGIKSGARSRVDFSGTEYENIRI